MMRRSIFTVWLSVCVLSVASASLLAQPQTFVTVRIADSGVARGNGVAAVTVYIGCGGGMPLEALLTLSQDNQATFGQAGIAGVVCDGIERAYSVQMRASSGTFRRGAAHASAYALICSTEACASGGATQTIALRGRPS